MRLRTVVFLFTMLVAQSELRAQLTSSDVQRVITQATARATEISPNSVIAVVDREGYVLVVWNVRGGEPTALEIARAVSKAGTGAFLSSNANAFTSRTAGFIIQQHFPPGVRNTAPGPLVGVGFSNLPFSDVNRFKQFLGPVPLPPAGVSPGTLGAPIPGTSLAGSPGGLPLYKNKRLVGGVGVTGDSSEAFVVDYDRDEDVALAGQVGFEAPRDITADDVFINGISLPYVRSGTNLPSPRSLRGNAAAGFPIQDSPAAFPYPVATFAGVTGEIRQPIVADPIATPINGVPRLTAAEVEGIIAVAADRVRTTRAGIRLPIGTRMEVFITVVNNPDTPSVSPAVLGAFRTGDATMFSWDVAVQKARTAVGFSDNRTAYSTRTVGFLAQTHFPPGIDPNPPGPFFGLQQRFSTAPPDPRFPNGITIFPGGFPLYRDGQLIGGVGISGDGVDQDDIVGASGSQNFLPPDAARADEFNFGGTRLPYAKFPRDPEGISRITPVSLPSFAALSVASAELANISARLQVLSGERRMIGGFIIAGTEAKRVVVRAIGPSLADAGVRDPLRDPQIELFDSSGASLTRSLRWQEGHEAELLADGLAPRNDSEAALVQTLSPGAYTAHVTAEDGASGVGLLEIYDVDRGSASRLANISARGFVGTGDDVLIGGFIIRGNDDARVLVRGIGPSLAAAGINAALADPLIEIRDSNGSLVTANSNWEEVQTDEIRETSLAPTDFREAAAVLALPRGAYTAILRGSGGTTGVGLIEIFRL